MDHDLALAVEGFLSRYPRNTRESYTRELGQFIDWCATHQIPVLAAKRAQIEMFSRWLQDVKEYAPSTAAKRISTVSCFYRVAMWDEYIVANPAEHVRRPQVSDESSRLGLDRLEMGAFLATARASSPTDSALIAMLLLLGLRITEACDTNIEDLGTERGHRTLTVMGKNNKKSTIPLPPTVFRALDQCIGERVEGAILMRAGGTRMTRVAGYRIVTRISKKAGITKTISPHSLRHSFVTAALDAGVPLRDVQIAARHSDPATTVRYDRARHNLDRHANHIVSAFISGGA